MFRQDFFSEALNARSATEWSVVARASAGASELSACSTALALSLSHLFFFMAFPFPGFSKSPSPESLPIGVAACLCADLFAPGTSSYPDSSIWERPTCHACLTAATGGSAPSNPRVNAFVHQLQLRTGAARSQIFSRSDSRKLRFHLPRLPLRGHPAEFFHRGPAGPPAPQVDGQLPGQRHDGLLSHRSAVGQFQFQALGGFPLRLPAQEAPHRFDEQRADPAVAHPIDGAHASLASRAVFAGTTAGVAADLFAVGKAVPVAHFAVEGDEG